jgi:hypothetical protein
MTTHTLKSKFELVAMLKLEAKKYNITDAKGRGVYVGPVESRPPDETECNWVLLLSATERETVYRLIDCINDFTIELRSKYNLPKDEEYCEIPPALANKR